MRKVLAVLLMFLVCTVYVMSIRTDDKGNRTEGATQQTSVEQVDVKQGIQEIYDTVKIAYPTTPKEVMQYYNKLMQYQYSKEAIIEDAPLAVDTMRMFYSKGLLNLNDYNRQIELFSAEVEANKENKLYLIESDIKSIAFTQENMALIEVVHTTTTKELERQYWMIREDEVWKIHKWQDTGL
ncbi:MAG: DUF6715 family protein [Cellulosilyticaceae bacterium]